MEIKVTTKDIDWGRRQFSGNLLGNWNSRNNYNGTRQVIPSNEHGNPLKCHICQSILLFSNMCPHKADNPKVTKDNQNQSKADG